MKSRGPLWSTLVHFNRATRGVRPAEMRFVKGNGNQVCWIQVTEMVTNNTFEEDYVPVLKKRTNRKHVKFVLFVSK